MGLTSGDQERKHEKKGTVGMMDLQGKRGGVDLLRVKRTGRRFTG